MNCARKYSTNVYLLGTPPNDIYFVDVYEG